MCGIYGIVRQDRQPIDPSTAEAMRRILHARGPDDLGDYAEPGALPCLKTEKRKMESASA